MDKNLSWTSSLGDAYYNQQTGCDGCGAGDAPEGGRGRQSEEHAAANRDGRRTRTSRLQPADPDVVYVPAYDPWLVYGYPIVAWPGWYPYPGIWFGGPYLSFGLGFGIGWWGVLDGDGVIGDSIGITTTRGFDGGRYYSRSRTFYNRSDFYRGGVAAWRAVSTVPEAAAAIQRRSAGGSRICCAARSERRALGRLQRLQPRRRRRGAFRHVAGPALGGAADFMAAEVLTEVGASVIEVGCSVSRT